MRLTGRTVLITGGTSGIGLELAAQLLARGNVVIVTGRDDKGIEAAKSRHPAFHAYKSDVSNMDEIQQLHTEVTARFPQLDTLVNNAGIMRNIQLTEERSLEDVTREIDVDLSGPIRMVQQFLPHLQRRSNALIVMVSSGIAFVPTPTAGKAGALPLNGLPWSYQMLSPSVWFRVLDIAFTNGMSADSDRAKATRSLGNSVGL